MLILELMAALYGKEFACVRIRTKMHWTTEIVGLELLQYG